MDARERWKAFWSSECPGGRGHLWLKTASIRPAYECDRCAADLIRAAETEAAAKARAEASKDANLWAELLGAASALLGFVQGRFPDDFKPGGKGYLCPHHKRLDAAVRSLAGGRSDAD